MKTSRKIRYGVRKRYAVSQVRQWRKREGRRTAPLGNTALSLLEQWLDRRCELVERILHARLLQHDGLKRLGDLVVDLARVCAGVVDRLAVWRAVEDRLRVRVRDLTGERDARRQGESGLEDLRLV